MTSRNITHSRASLRRGSSRRRFLEQDYGRDLRLALVTALVLFIAGFRIIRVQGAPAFALRSPRLTVIDQPAVVSPTLYDPQVRPRPGLVVAAPNGTDPCPTDGPSPVDRTDPGPVSAGLPVIGLDGVVEHRPSPLELPLPSYPEVCRKVGIGGTVVLKLLVEPDSSVSRVEMLRSSGNRLFDAAALRAAARARFTPGRQGIQPVRVWVAVPYVFRVD